MIGDLLFFCENMFRLMEAAWLIHENNKSKKATVKSVSKPDQYFNDFFQFYSLVGWESKLHNILYFLLSGEMNEARNTLALKIRLEKLIWGCHLIPVQERDAL